MENTYVKVKPQEVKEGDVVRIEFGDYGNFVECVIMTAGNVSKYGTFHFTAKRCADGVTFEFCSQPNSEMLKIG